MPKELVTFDKVIPAIKNGKKAARMSWPAGSLKLAGSMVDDKVVGLVLEVSGVVSGGSLHNNDLLADDWEIMD